MKIAKEIDQLLATNGLYPVDRIGIAAPLISAKLEPVRAALRMAQRLRLPLTTEIQDAIEYEEKFKAALALFEEE